MGDGNTQKTYPMLPIKQEGTCSFPLPSFYTPLSSNDNYTNQHQYPFSGSTHQLVDVKQEQGCSYEYHPSGNIANFSNQYACPLVHASGNAKNHNLHSLRSDDRKNPEKQDLFTLNDFYHHDLHWLESSGANPCIEANTSLVTANVLHGTSINSTYAINDQPQPGYSNTRCMFQSFLPSIVGRVEHPEFFSSNYSHGMSSYGGYIQEPWSL